MFRLVNGRLAVRWWRGVDACLLVLDSWSKSYNGRIEDVSDAVLNPTAPDKTSTVAPA